MWRGHALSIASSFVLPRDMVKRPPVSTTKPWAFADASIGCGLGACMFTLSYLVTLFSLPLTLGAEVPLSS